MSKFKLACYWASTCGGCEVVILDVHERILEIIELAEIVFWPCATDFKRHHVESYEDGYIDVCLFNGAIRTEHDLEMAHLLRKKSKYLIAFGACAVLGGIPGLGNFHSNKELMERAYLETPSSVNANPRKIMPTQDGWFSVKMKEGEIGVPPLESSVRALNQVTDVDFYIPGCPTNPDLVYAAVKAVAEGNLPPKGTVFGGPKNLCEECDKKKDEKKIKKIKRLHLTPPEDIDPERCLMEQGIICCGPATRSGCGAMCTKINMPCRGCFGPADGVQDMGAKILSSVASILDAETEEEARKMVDDILDPAGTFYRFSLPVSLLHKKRITG